MPNRWWSRVFVVAALVSAPLLAGDYDHVLDVVKQAWPARAKGMAICSLEANQFTLLDLVETAKARGISLVIINIKEIRDMEKTLQSALQRRPDFCLIIDDDTVLGSKSTLINRVVGRAAAQGVPTVGLSPEPLKFGAVLAVGAAPGAPILVNLAMARRMKLEIPEGAVDPTAPVQTPVQAPVPVPAAVPVPAPVPAPPQ